MDFVQRTHGRMGCGGYNYVVVMKAKTIYTDEHGPVVSMDDFDILQRSHDDLLQAIENILKGRRKGDKERFYWLEVDIEDDYAAEDAIKKAKGL